MIAGSIVARVRVNSQVPTCDIDPRKQRTGVAPNFIHSVDSSHMVKTINATDFTAYAMIHDDFGTHAGNTEELWTQIRKSFVDMYEKSNPLKDWLDYQDLEARNIKELPLPEQGELDLRQVLNSSFFFG